MIEYTAVPEFPGWSRADLEGSGEELPDMAKKLNETRKAGTYFVCAHLPGVDRGDFLYRVETSNPLEIMEICEVGSHGFSTMVETVLAELGALHSENPIVPHLAATSCFGCTFEKPVSDEFAGLINETITEGFEAYDDEDWADIGAVVQRDGYLQLWWD